VNDTGRMNDIGRVPATDRVRVSRTARGRVNDIGRVPAADRVRVSRTAQEAAA
jgi:hypothetical protein